MTIARSITSWLLSRLGYVRQAGLAFLCLWSFHIFLVYRPAVGNRFLLVFVVLVAAALTVLSAGMVIRLLLARAQWDDPARRLERRVNRSAGLIVRVFIYTGLLTYANAVLDLTEPMERSAEVAAVSEFEVALGSLVVLSRADLRWSDQSDHLEPILLWDAERRWLWVGEPVIVHFKSGLFGIPWIVKLERDEKRYAEQVLRLFPTASQAWKNLVAFDLERRRWDDAYTTASQYLVHYPEDYEFALSTAGALGVAFRHDKAVALLEPFLTRRRDYELYNVVGWSLAKLGEAERAVALLTSSIPLDPDNFWAYYHLAYVYRNRGQTVEATRMFEAVLDRRSNFPEVEEQLRLLRARPAGQS